MVQRHLREIRFEDLRLVDEDDIIQVGLEDALTRVQDPHLRLKLQGLVLRQRADSRDELLVPVNPLEVRDLLVPVLEHVVLVELEAID